ncbi:hypothetical protein RMSM_06200 [Rhodopirellula maiorica SM1]|uniref:Uncharacterized protein n=1 Tax=Rhodopirellula maiorica SM1 TaxID=1265738 RepID=M5RSE7_9BACT|nr:hypothetical protein RMSM_06200 [Rhodopirellula maiorica SM1]
MRQCDGNERPALLLAGKTLFNRRHHGVRQRGRCQAANLPAIARIERKMKCPISM